MTKEKTCKERVRESYLGRMADLRKLWRAEQEGKEVRDLGEFGDYGLAFDYVSPGIQGNRRGYFRYQLSWGGPADEFRFFCDEWKNPYRIEYWFLDWNDGAKITLGKGKSYDLLAEIFDYFREMGIVDSEMELEAGR